MKRTKFLALALVVAIMTMGAGYAYWSDTLTINNTVSTGEMNVDIIEANLTDGEDPYVDVDFEISDDNKMLTFEALDLYPGAEISYTAKVENNGTIPVVYDGIELTDKSLATLPTGKTVFTASEMQEHLKHVSHIVQIDGVNVNPAELVQLEPDEVATLNVVIKLDEALGEGADPDELENVYSKYEMKVNFKQHNE